jgi:hypothetical protein
MFSQQVENDVENSFRTYGVKNKELSSIGTIQGNLQHMAKEFDSAQEHSDKLARKGGKANANKVDQATQKLQAAQSEWDTQAPFIFEKLQSIDESRLNHMRDTLTQLLTLEADQVERNRVTAEETLNALLEVDTTVEIYNFAAQSTRGKPKIERRALGRSSSSQVGAASAQPPPTLQSRETEESARDSASQHSESIRSPSGM